MDPDYEKRLIEQARTDPRAFRELYQHYFPRLYRYVAVRVGSKEDAEDVVSEIFLKALEKLPNFVYQGEAAFAKWVFRIAFYTVGSFYRRQARERARHYREEPPPLADNPLQALMQKEQFERLHQSLRTLSRRRQEVIALRFFGGLRNQEIAAVLQLDERTVASHLCRGLEDLHERYRALEAQS